MPKPKPLSKELIKGAMSQTLSNRAAARYLNCSYQHYKKWAKLYESDTHDNLFEQHKNQSGKGIPKFLRSGGKEPALVDIIEGRIDASSFSPEKIKYRLITEGHLLEECAVCGFNERRVSDYKMPLLLNFKDFIFITSLFTLLKVLLIPLKEALKKIKSSDKSLFL